MRWGCTVPSPLTWPSTTKCDDTKTFAMTGSVDGCSVLPEIQYVLTSCAFSPHVLSVVRFLPSTGAAAERSEFDIKPHLKAPLLNVPRGYLLKTFPHGAISAMQQGFELRVFLLLGDLPKAIEPHLPVCQLSCWWLHPTKWSSPMTMLLDPIVVTAPVLGFQWVSLGPATNCLQLSGAWGMDNGGVRAITSLHHSASWFQK